jgi:hypothetical protein
VHIYITVIAIIMKVRPDATVDAGVVLELTARHKTTASLVGVALPLPLCPGGGRALVMAAIGGAIGRACSPGMPNLAVRAR